MFAWPCVNIFAMLQLLVRQCPQFATFMRERITATRPSPQRPWRLILYNDEAQPGNLLSLDGTRKCQLIYFSFMEWGHDVLCRDHAWILAGLVRSSVALKTVGGMSCLLRLLLNSWFGPSFNLLESGCTLDCGDEHVLLFGRPAIVISDEAAMKGLFCNKGASGIKPCMYCKNVCLPRSRLAEVSGDGYLIDLGNFDYQQLDLQTDQTIWQSIDMLQRRSGIDSKKDFKELEQALGFNHQPHGLLADMFLRRLLGPISCTMIDWMHTWLVGGIASWECWCFFKACKAQCGLNFSQFEAFVKTFTMRRADKNLAGTFSKKREAACMLADAFKAGASEILGVYPLIRIFISKVLTPMGALAVQCASFLALCEVLDSLGSVNSGRASPDQLAQQIQRHLGLFFAAYPDETPKPKHHAALHIPDQLRHHGTLLSCFVQERRHRLAKRVLGFSTKLQSFEFQRSVNLISYTLEQFNAEHAFATGMFLRGAKLQEIVKSWISSGSNTRLQGSLRLQDA